jgi:hypothetical protein
MLNIIVKADIDVVRVKNKKMMNEFIIFPWTSGIYLDDLAWVPPLIQDMNKFLNPRKGYFFEIGEAEFFIAYLNAKPAGRISAHVNHLYEKYYNMDTGFFGFFESIDNAKVAASLFKAAEEWLIGRGKKIMNGPQSFSIYDEVGFEVRGEDLLPSTGLSHSASYYKNLADFCGFRKCIDWHCVDVKGIGDSKLSLAGIRDNLISRSDIVYKTLDRKDLPQRAVQIKNIFNRAWEGNWGHLPLTDKQFEYFFKHLSLLVIPELAIFAEADGETVGFIISIPDSSAGIQYLNGRMNPLKLLKALKMVKKSKRLRTIIMGVLPEYRRQMIDSVFYLKTIETGINMGFEVSDCSLIVETNKRLLNSLRHLNGEIRKTYRIYEKNI